jgi:hypothetical protein
VHLIKLEEAQNEAACLDYIFACRPGERGDLAADADAHEQT